MKIKLPGWAEHIEDEGVLTFLAFAKRMAEQHGWEEWYNMHETDAGRICNKRIHGLIPWLQSYDEIHKYMEIGQPLSGSFIFRFRSNQPKCGTVGIALLTNSFHWTKLKTTRAQLLWSYLLGCTNNNLIGENNIKPGFENTYGVSVFKLDRQAGDYRLAGYQKKNKEPIDE